MAEWSAVAVAATFALGLVHARWFVLAGTCAAVSAAVVTTGMRRVKSLTVWLVSWCITADGWVLLAHLRTPWQPGLLVALPAAALVLLPPGVRALAHDAHWQRLADERDAERDAARFLGRWAKAFERIHIAGITALEETERGSTRKVLLRLPQDGRVTVSSLRSARADLERSARLPRDSIRFEEVEHDASLAWMHVVEKRFLATAIPLPELPAFMTVTGPLPIGRTEDGETFSILLREMATMIVGARGSGKTTLLHVLIALLGRCVDTVVCVIDVDKGDRMCAPWVLPWVQGKAVRPAVDWIATTRAEAEIMLSALHRVGKARQASMAGGSKITPSANLPQFILICDEMAGLLGMDFTSKPDGPSNQAFFKLAMDLTRLWRSEAIEPVFASQRGTGSFTGGNDLKSQCMLRGGLGTATQQEALSLFPDDGQAARLLASLSGKPGSSLWQHRGDPMLPVMLYRLDPADRKDASRLEQVAITNATIRPEPDALSREAMGDAWAKRWERSPLYLKLRDQEHPPAPREERPEAALPADVTSAFNQIAGQLGDIVPARGTKNPHPGKGRMHSILADDTRRVIGISAMELHHRLVSEGFEVARPTVHLWLSEAINQGIVEKYNGLYRLRRDVRM